jgi:citrate synthase
MSKGIKELPTKAKLEVDGKTIELPVFMGTEGEKAIDIGELRAKTGCITMDNGFMNTGSCYSSVTFLDGDLGTLNYRGYAIDDIAQKSTFTDVAYLLIKGTLPTLEQSAEFKKQIAKNSSLPEGIVQLIKTFPRSAHPMSILSAAVVALSGYESTYVEKIPTGASQENMMCQLLGQVKTIIANIYRHKMDLPFLASNPNLGYEQDFLQMMFGPSIKQESIQTKALDILLMLHADHEQNCSTSTVRMVGSSKANLFATMSAGIDALWGPLHGGANQKVIEMLEAMEKDGGDYKKFIGKAKDKNDSFLLMGFGHRVYKNFDPRANIIKRECDQVLASLGVKDSLLTIAKGLEQEALSDDYFVSRKLYPNVDFYSGIIYRAMGIPTDMFTAMFALGRLPGWLCQWKELMESDSLRIARPRQIYTGETLRPYNQPR